MVAAWSRHMNLGILSNNLMRRRRGHRIIRRILAISLSEWALKPELVQALGLPFRRKISIQRNGGTPRSRTIAMIVAETTILIELQPINFCHRSTISVVVPTVNLEI